MIEGPALGPGGATLLGALARNARNRPEHDSVRFLATGEDTTASVSYSALLGRVDEVACGLVARGLAGRPVVLALPPGIDFVTAVLATFRAGAFAVTIPFPVGASGERIAAIVGDAQPAAVVALRSEEAQLPGAPAGLPVWTLEELRVSGLLPPEPAADHPALIQYSSGSTRTPCGVVVTHGNLAANVAMIERAFGLDVDRVAVHWLPPFHDMGLIGAILAPLFAGGTAVLMPPAAFLAKPLRWLRAIERHRGTVAGAPNFGYELCTRRVPPDAARELDLTSWTLAYCGSEPIRLTTLDGFARRFEPAGFSRDAFLACYGLAEATLLASAGPLREIACKAEGVALRQAPGDQRTDVARVSCGRPAPGCGIDVLPESGEICITGPHVSPGRWSGRRGAVVPWEESYERDGRRFMRTGDLGAIVDGEIVVLDRLKDVIAVYGRKVHAVDVERAVLEAEGGAVVAAAAFAIPSERGERLVTLCEISARELRQLDHANLKSALGGVVSAATGIAPEIVLLRRGVLPRTSSGKIRRHACRSEYLAGLRA
jgi:acyl-CoA synthetase (AMP-forming)/AMP-acid ligase II